MRKTCFAFCCSSACSGITAAGCQGTRHKLRQSADTTKVVQGAAAVASALALSVTTGAGMKVAVGNLSDHTYISLHYVAQVTQWAELAAACSRYAGALQCWAYDTQAQTCSVSYRLLYLAADLLLVPNPLCISPRSNSIHGEGPVRAFWQRVDSSVVVVLEKPMLG